jgi:hypothetical protein
MKSRREYEQQLKKEENKSWQLFFLSIYLVAGGLLGGAFALKNYDEKISLKEEYEFKIYSLRI